MPFINSLTKKYMLPPNMTCYLDCKKVMQGNYLHDIRYRFEPICMRIPASHYLG
jgi:hypothetical protein